jgi:hypothetical protein
LEEKELPIDLRQPTFLVGFRNLDVKFLLSTVATMRLLFGSFLSVFLFINLLEGQDRSVPLDAKVGGVHAEFLRIAHDEQGQPRALETAIAPYISRSPNGKFPQARIDLVGAVHIGEAKYYEELNRRFKDYDVVLYELVAPEGTRIKPEDIGKSGSPLSAMQTGMKDILKLEFQLEKVDYQAANFLHADMSVEEFASDMSSRGDSLMKMAFRMMGAGLAMQASGKGNDAGMFLALMAPDRVRQLRRTMARQFQDMEVVTSGFADASGKSTLITERNAKAFEVLKTELEAGKKKIAVFYGAGHLPDMGKKLITDFEMKPEVEKTEYLEAWDLR